MRGADGARREDDFAAAARAALPSVLAPPHAGGAQSVEREAGDEASGFKAQIGARQHRLEKAGRRRPPSPALLVDVEIAGAFVVACVEIGDRLDAPLRRT